MTTVSAKTIDLTQFAEAVNCALAEQAPCIVATSDVEGNPDIAFKGSTMVFDKDHLAFLERSHGRTIEYLARNPRVVVLYRNRLSRQISGWRFYGEAQVLPSGPIRDEIRERSVEPERLKDPDNKGIGVLIRVDRVQDMPGAILQERERA